MLTDEDIQQHIEARVAHIPNSGSSWVDMLRSPGLIHKEIAAASFVVRCGTTPDEVVVLVIPVRETALWLCAGRLLYQRVTLYKYELLAPLGTANDYSFVEAVDLVRWQRIN
jgi:hypothetical protein